MTTPIKLMGLLTLEETDKSTFEVGEKYTIVKSGYRMAPMGVPMELADVNFKYIGKAKIIKIVATVESSEITFEMLKIFSPEESLVYTNNFI